MIISLIFWVFLVVVVIASLCSSCAVASLVPVAVSHGFFFIWRGPRDFCIVLGTMPVSFQSRPKQLIDNTVDAIRFAWRSSYLPARLFAVLPAAEAKSKVSPRAQIVWDDDEMELEGKRKATLRKRFVIHSTSLFLSFSLVFFRGDSILSWLLLFPRKEKKTCMCLHLAAAGPITQMRNNWSALLINLIWISDISCNHTRITKVGLDCLLYK